MSEQVQNGAGATTPGEDAVNQLFTPQQQAQEQAQEQPAAPDTARWPDQFLNADGSLNEDAARKSWFDTKRAHTDASQRLAELERASKEGVPETADGYWNTWDESAFREAAPKAFPEGEQQKATLKALYESLHAAGMPEKRAHALAADFYGRVDKLLPDVPAPMTDAEAIDAAAAQLPNGDIVKADVQAWLAERARSRAFSEGEMTELKGLLRRPHGQLLIQRLSRESGAGAPPSIDRSFLGVDKKQAKATLRAELGNQDDGWWEMNKDRVMADYERLGGID